LGKAFARYIRFDWHPAPTGVDDPDGNAEFLMEVIGEEESGAAYLRNVFGEPTVQLPSISSTG